MPDDCTCYFVTLTYINRYIPYIRKSELVGKDQGDWLSVYRDNDVVYRKVGKRKFSKTIISDCTVLDYVDVTDPIGDDFSLLHGLRTKTRSGFHVDPDKIAVYYSADSKNFLKRFRQNIFRSYKERLPISYYCCPEYGPATSRPHLHMLLWIPNCLSFSQVSNLIVKSWPYAEASRTRKYIEVARNAADYVASYINTSAEVSPWLLKNFKLRPTHSLYFGYDSEDFKLSNIIDHYKKGEFSYKVQQLGDSSQTVNIVDIPYPSYVLDKYFPTFKNSSVLSTDTLLRCYEHPERMFSINTSVCSYVSLNGTFYYATSVVTKNGSLVLMSKNEASYTINKINRAKQFLRNCLPHGADVSRFIFDFLNARASYSYKHQFDDVPVTLHPYLYVNIHDFAIKDRIPPTLKSYCKDIPVADLLFEKNPFEISRNIKLLDKYNDNIKQRKINSL